MPTLRTLALLAVAAATLALAAFWLLTLPAVVPASALPPYTPNLDNGRTMFNSRRLRVLPCRTQQGPRQGRSHPARRRLGAHFAVRHLLRAEYLA